MKISEKAMKKFKALYKKHFGVELSPEDAYRLANNLLNLYKVIYSVPLDMGKHKGGCHV